MQRRKKGQIAGQVFIYIMAVIVVGGIALIGYSAIKNILSKSCDAEKANFKSDLDLMIEKYTSYGSVNKKMLSVPCDYTSVCFVDGSMIGKPLGDCQNRVIGDAAASGTEQNIFVISNKQTIGIGYSPLISLPSGQQNNCTCISVENSNFYITFNGKGSSVEISAG